MTPAALLLWTGLLLAPVATHVVGRVRTLADPPGTQRHRYPFLVTMVCLAVIVAAGVGQHTYWPGQGGGAVAFLVLLSLGSCAVVHRYVTYSIRSVTTRYRHGTVHHILRLVSGERVWVNLEKFHLGPLDAMVRQMARH